MSPKSLWHDGLRVPALHQSMLKGRKGGRPKKGGRLRYSAYDMIKFCLARCVLAG